VSSGGSSYYTQISSGGHEIIMSGGYGPYATIHSGGLQTIAAGGLDSGSTILSGGSQVVYGTVSGITVQGTQTIHSGGSGVNGVISGGFVSGSSGSYLLGYSMSGSGGVLSASGLVSASAAGGLALNVTRSGNSAILDNGQIAGSVSYGGAGNLLSLRNGTTLNGAVVLSDTSQANTLELSGAQSLVLASAPTSGAAVVSGWQNFNVSSGASLSLRPTDSAVDLNVGTLNNAGDLTIGASQMLTVSGNYNQTGNLAVGVQSPTSYGKMEVKGHADVTGGKVSVTSGSTLAKNTTYSGFFKAGSVAGAFDTSGTYGAIKYSVAQDGTAFNLVTEGSSDPANAGLTPVFNGGQANATLNLALAGQQIVRDRMDRMDGKAYLGTDANNYTWVAPFAALGQQSNASNASGAYKLKSIGFAMGVDAPVADDLRIGAAAIIQNTGFNGQNSATQDGLTTTSYQLTGYAKQKFGDAGEVRFIANAAEDQNSSIRQAQANGMSSTMTASYGGWHGVASAEVNHSWQTGNSTLTPLVRLDYGYAQVNGYTESGNGGTNLNLGSQSTQSLIGAGGARYQIDVAEKHRIILRGVAGYDFAAKGATLYATDVNGIGFTTKSNKPGSFITDAGLGYEYETSDLVRVRASYDFFGRSAGYSNSMFNFNVIVPFK
jgi:autotransporter passenger strand-loop-strand repeat protein